MPLPGVNKSGCVSVENETRFTRTEQLIGKTALKKLQAAKVAVFGLGGVGSYVLETLARSGVGSFVLIDSDRISVSNINRQLFALETSVGQFKTDAAVTRLSAIASDIKTDCLNVFYSEQTAASVEPHIADCSYIVDAVDTVSAKLLIVQTAQKLHIPVISCMGTGNKINPGLLEVADIFKTSVCPLAKVMRRELKARGIKSLKTVYSKENPICSQRPPASIAFVPAAAGLLIASQVVKDIISPE
jgi:hypothetical protein ELI_4115